MYKDRNIIIFLFLGRKNTLLPSCYPSLTRSSKTHSFPWMERKSGVTFSKRETYISDPRRQATRSQKDLLTDDSLYHSPCAYLPH